MSKREAAGHVMACVGCQQSKSTPAAPAEPRCQNIWSQHYARHCAGIVTCIHGPRPIVEIAP
jgi:hypothetical protein